MTGDRVLIVLPNGAALALPVDVYREALAEGARLIGVVAAPSATQADEPLMTAAELAADLKVPVSRVEAAGRTGAIPVVKVGRYARYHRSSAVAALTNGGRA